MVFCQGTSPKVDQAAPDRRLPGPGGCTLTQLLEGGGVALDRRSHQGLLLNDGSDRRHEKDEEKSHRSSDLGRSWESHKVPPDVWLKLVEITR